MVVKTTFTGRCNDIATIYGRVLDIIKADITGIEVLFRGGESSISQLEGIWTYIYALIWVYIHKMEDSCFYWNLQFSAVITRRASICNKLFYP
ncbi:hypothetical protein P029_03050 [Anaplasma phagocytophilum str. Norway variant2]|nr:hypothetical protein P029_03050 [Anaplasma phagocytophilum str. Norway variant2]